MKTTIILLLAINLGYAQVLTTLPHIIEGVEYDHLPHDGIDYLPFTLDTDPDSLFDELYYNALTSAGLAESAYFQNEEWQYECRLDSQRVIDFYSNHFAPLFDLVIDQWNLLRDIQTDPSAVAWFTQVDPFAQSAFDDVTDAIAGYVAIMQTPGEKCDQFTPQLNGHVSNMVRARYFFEQVLLTVAPYYNRDPKNPLR